MNGVNISNPNHSFSPDEWDRLGPEGRDQVVAARHHLYNNQYGNQGGRSQHGSFRNSTGGRGRGNPGRHVSFVETDDNQNNTSQNAQQQRNDVVEMDVDSVAVHMADANDYSDIPFHVCHLYFCC